MAVRYAVVAVALFGALVGLSVGHAPAAAAAGCGPAPTGSAAVAVVVDTGAGAPVVRCVTVRERASGRAVLQAAGIPFRVGSGTPADNNQGGAFLCGILGVPQTGCAAPSPTGISYWAYFRQAAGGSWTYSRVGFDTPVGSRCWVEGWRWTTSGGVAAASNPPPRTPPPDVACAATPSSTAAPVTAAPAPPPTAAPSPSSTGAPVPGAPVAPTTTVPNDVEAPATSTPGAQVAGETTVAPPSSSVADGEPRDAGQEEAAAPAGTPSSDGGFPWVALAAVLAAAALGGAALYRARQRQ